MPNAVVPAALISVDNKDGVTRLASALQAEGFRIVATTSTAAAIRAAGIRCDDVEQLTGFASLCGGRVKTLHPKVFAGILARSASAQDMQDLARLDVPAFSVVAVNLYAFESAAKGDVDDPQITEQIDIGGVALLRAAAKNFCRVSVLSDPSQYEAFIERLHAGGTALEERRRLASEAFSLCQGYDAAIASFLNADAAQTEAGVLGADGDLPDVIALNLAVRQRLGYGENPWARAAFYSAGKAENPCEQLAGRPLSYNNLLDLDSCLRLVARVEEPLAFPASAIPAAPVAAAIVKHTVPCGVAARQSSSQALSAALGADPISAFGGVVACGAPLDEAAAQLLKPRFLDVVAAPGYSSAALEILRSKKNLRVLCFEAGLPARLRRGEKVRSALGGLLVEYPDEAAPADRWEIVSGSQPSGEQWRDLLFAFAVVAQVKSNAAVVVRGQATLGICAGQTNRVTAVALACTRAGDGVRGASLATDGFFPFADGLEAAANAGISAVVAPSGSIRDREVIAAARAAGLSLVFASRRYFLH
ncbi:MAG: bifunctional phosphoribosylaminoimidazolecarboxamide formyltransferase/IMP cyclohydrolase [Candidatus Eremiobacteraeota bacterium]|nr:bifunctional phosphoribosylaminoimidazolecarboxamide formyltransferase/IMP cyclohydrolase [Candidatus Eremiobacteraeota bacterium]MBC5827165.1 bifunctional phosphoribosylaminoimidazolecarboxamide formyltransferase/IMP cyclohydrolase [Candidatus Eremiobacteraeota bacterium]